MTQANPFAATVVSGFGEVRPSFAALGLGRLIAAIPRGEAFKSESKFKDQATGQPRMTNTLVIDLIVFDGPVFQFGGDPDDGKPHTHSSAAPTIFRNVQIKGDRIIDQIVSSSAGGMKIPLGRLGKKAPRNGGRAMWEILEPSAADQQTAMNVWTTLARPLWDQAYAGQPLAVPPVIELNAPPQATMAPVTPQFGQVPPMAMPNGPFAPQPLGGQAAPIAPQQPSWPAFPAMPAAPAPVVDWTIGALAQIPGSPIPPDQWAAATRDMREQFLTQAGITGPVVPVGTPTGL